MNRLITCTSLIITVVLTVILFRLPERILNVIGVSILFSFCLLMVAVVVYLAALAKIFYRGKRAEVIKMELEAGLSVHTNGTGETYIYRSKELARNSEIIPAHLLTAPYNGSPTNSNEDNNRHWLIHTTRNTKVIEGQLLPTTQELLPLLPILLKSQRVIIGGGSDSGKSTIAKHLIAARSQEGQIIPIDPHSPSKLLGIDVIGAGRNWQAIGLALESLELLMHERYTEVAQGLMGYFQHQRISIFIDEWTSIVEEVPEAGKRLKILLTESRKVNMFLTLLTHATTLDGLGLPSAQLKKSALIVELVGGNGDQPYRAFVHPQTTINTEGKKAKPVEYMLPGPFSGYPDTRDITNSLPAPQLIKIQRMSNEGMSKRAMIKMLYPEVDNPGKRHYALVEQLLSEAETLKKAYLD